MQIEIGTVVRQYEIISKLGEGGGGLVFKAKRGRNKFALKFTDSSARNTCCREVKYMTMLQTENISVKCYDSFIWNEYCVIVMEECKIDLLEYLLNNKLSLHDVKLIFKQICANVNKIHKLNIYHRDLKPENILLNNINSLRITDFANCIYAPEKCCISARNIGTLQYNAPEISRSDFYNPEQADVWSIGVILHVLLTGKWPFGNISALLYGDPNFGISESLYYDNDLVSLLESMLDIEPTKRPSLSDILVHPWLGGNDNNEVSRCTIETQDKSIIQIITSTLSKLYN